MSDDTSNQSAAQEVTAEWGGNSDGARGDGDDFAQVAVMEQVTTSNGGGGRLASVGPGEQVRGGNSDEARRKRRGTLKMRDYYVKEGLVRDPVTGERRARRVVREVYRLADSAESEAVRLQAAAMLTDRIDGKAPQSIAVSSEHVEVKRIEVVQVGALRPIASLVAGEIARSTDQAIMALPTYVEPAPEVIDPPKVTTAKPVEAVEVKPKPAPKPKLTPQQRMEETRAAIAAGAAKREARRAARQAKGGGPVG